MRREPCFFIGRCCTTGGGVVLRRGDALPGGVRLEGALVAKAEAIAAARKRLGTFILAKNELDEQALSAE
ncbi:hypothetical protein [Rhodothermus marinus]|uniref:hypothetical protein n=1 Tax=Rhodothermus marinus TaxID=29549 RepID=UPI0001A3051E|nr:hypothetical protein [Rhodothermus marinus]